jgi:hypothetical protein
MAERRPALLGPVLALCGACASAPAPAPAPATTASVAPAPLPPPPPAPTASASAAAATPAPPVPEPDPPGFARRTGVEADQALAEGDAAFAAGDGKKATAAYTKAQRLAPKDPAPIAALAHVTLDGVPFDVDPAKHQKALAPLVPKLAQAVTLDPNYAPAHREQGRLLLALGKSADAIPSLEKAAKLAPNDLEAATLAGIALMSTGKSQAALPHLQRAGRRNARAGRCRAVHEPRHRLPAPRAAQ